MTKAASPRCQHGACSTAPGNRISVGRVYICSVQPFRLMTTSTVWNRSQLEKYMSDQQEQQKPITTTDASIPASSDEYPHTERPSQPTLLRDSYLVGKTPHCADQPAPVLYEHANSSDA